MDVFISNLVMLHESLHYFSQNIMIFLTIFYVFTNAAVVSVELEQIRNQYLLGSH